MQELSHCPKKKNQTNKQTNKAKSKKKTTQNKKKIDLSNELHNFLKN
jgi:hypothetical protein